MPMKIPTVTDCGHRLLDSIVVECWLRVREVPGSIPSQEPRHTKDVIKMVPVVALFSTQHWKGKYWLFLKNKDKKIMDKIWYRNPSKSEVIGRCCGHEKNEWPRRTDKSRTLKKIKNKNYCGLTSMLNSQTLLTSDRILKHITRLSVYTYYNRCSHELFMMFMIS